MGTKKKSNSEIRRMIKRAEASGRTYIPPPYYIESKRDKKPNLENQSTNDYTDHSTSKATNEHNHEKQDEQNESDSNEIMLRVAIGLEKELERIQNDDSIKSKERRSAKRRAEAIAIEKSGCSSTEELLRWFEEHKEKEKQLSSRISNQQGKNKSKDDQGYKKNHNPYIAFVGQLSYETTKDDLFRHFEKELGSQHKITKETLIVRLLTNEKTKLSRGMAFVQVTDPEMLYSCLKLHHTYLNGRRINVERSAGGKSNSSKRKSKIENLRQEQSDHINSVVDAMILEYYNNGSIQRGEIDDGVIALCKRHPTSVVQAALNEYVTKQGRDMDNPSAYLTFLIGKMAQEGIRDKDDNDDRKNNNSSNNSIETTKQDKGDQKKGKRQPLNDPVVNDNNNNNNKNNKNNSHNNKKIKIQATSSLANYGVDMSISYNQDLQNEKEKEEAINENTGDLSFIFPSYSRGRGRGRGR